MSFICLTSSQVLIAANLSKSDREKAFVKSWQYGFALVSFLSNKLELIVGAFSWFIDEAIGLGSGAKYPDILDHGRMLLLLYVFPPLPY